MLNLLKIISIRKYLDKETATCYCIIIWVYVWSLQGLCEAPSVWGQCKVPRCFAKHPLYLYKPKYVKVFILVCMKPIRALQSMPNTCSNKDWNVCMNILGALQSPICIGISWSPLCRGAFGTPQSPPILRKKDWNVGVYKGPPQRSFAKPILYRGFMMSPKVTRDFAKHPARICRKRTKMCILVYKALGFVHTTYTHFSLFVYGHLVALEGSRSTTISETSKLSILLANSYNKHQSIHQSLTFWKQQIYVCVCDFF